MTGSVASFCVLTFSYSMPVTVSSPRMRFGTESQMKCILGLAKARSWVILAARSSSRRWMTCTASANLARNRPSSMAESPPPMTATCLPL